MYSSAKAITATIVHMLVERGQFSLDDRVCEYLPTYTSHGKDRTTIRHVMTHSAGVPFPTGPKPTSNGRMTTSTRRTSSESCGRCTGRGWCTSTTRSPGAR